MSLIGHYRWFSAGILLVFLIPRVPAFTIDQDTPLSPATGDFNSSIPTQFMSSPANFSFPAYADFEVNTGSNFIPLKITHLNALVFDLDTSHRVGNGDVYGLTLPAKKFVNLQVPVNFSYVAENRSDITCKAPSIPFRYDSATDPSNDPGANWYNACRNRGQYPDGQRPSASFRRCICSQRRI